MALSPAALAKLAAHHNLNMENSTDSEVDDAIANSLNDDEAMELANRAVAGDEARAELHALREATADADLVTHKNRIGDSDEAKAFWRPQLISNRAAALAAIGKIPAPAAGGKGNQPLHNRASAQTPNAHAKAANAAETDRKVLANKVRTRANDILNAARAERKAMDYPRAHRQASQELMPVAEETTA